MKKSGLRFWFVVLMGVAVIVCAAAFLNMNVGVTQIRSEADIARSPHDVFEYVTTPANWPRWHPSSIAVTGDAAGHALALGESVTEEFRVAGHHGFATWTVVERDPDRRWRIEARIDGKVSGTVTYSLASAGSGTHFVRDFDYPSRTIFFAALNAIWIRPRIVAESDTAVSQLRAALEGARSGR